MKPGEIFEICISRHAPKIEKDVVDVTKQEIDIEAVRQEVAELSAELLQKLEQTPKGTIMAFQPSNIKRAEQTRKLMVEEIKQRLKDRSDIEMVELGEDKGEALRLLERIKNELGKKFIISDLRGTWLIGFKEDDKSISAINKWKNKLGGNENLLGKVWAAHNDEIPALVEQLQRQDFNISVEDINLKDFQSTPEDQVIRFISWLRAMKRIGETRFPARPLILEGISHNLRMDYTMLALLREEISIESIDRILGGEFRKPLERSTITFTDDGKVRVEYREIAREFSEEEYDEILTKLRDKSEQRKQEWIK